MNRANQMQVVQEANMGLIDIRSNELEYFSFFFSSFGTYSLMMAGFMVGALSQQNCGYDSDPGAPYGSVVFYWLSCALCAATGIYTLCGAEMTIIFGQNLAINGPVGSMIVALEGMLQEQKTVVFGCLWTSFFFICQSVGMFWFRMDQISAISTSCVCGAAILMTYRWLLQIYNRFNWRKKQEMNWDRTLSTDLRDLRPSIVEDISSWFLGRPSISSSRNPSMSERPSISELTGVVSGLSSKVGGMGNGGVTGGGDRASTINGMTVAPVVASNRLSQLHHQQYKAGTRTLLLGGLLTMLTRSKITRRSIWKRRYVILKNNYVYFYRSRRDFSLNPTHPINQRPIDLEGYTLIGGASKPPYAISLAPMDSEEDFRKVWKFRCDTLAEFNRWIEALMTAITISNEGQDMNEYIKIMPEEEEVGDSNVAGAVNGPGANTIVDDDEDD